MSSNSKSSDSSDEEKSSSNASAKDDKSEESCPAEESKSGESDEKSGKSSESVEESDKEANGMCAVCEQVFGSRDEDCPEDAIYIVSPKGKDDQECQACRNTREGVFGKGATTVRGNDRKRKEGKTLVSAQHFPTLLKENKKVRLAFRKERKKYVKTRATKGKKARTRYTRKDIAVS